jgi:hypothetical protein
MTMRRFLAPLRLIACACALAGVVLLALAATALAAPGFEAAPSPQSSVVGTPITPVTVKGTELARVTAKALPAGLNLSASAAHPETEWEITGTPEVAKAAKVTLEAENSAKEHATPIEFEWTVAPEAVPTFAPAPSAQSSVVGTSITPVVITGTKLSRVTATALPTGLVLSASASHPETEWEITGTPEAAQAATKVTLEATNHEKGGHATIEFEWTVKAPEAAKPPTVETPAKPTETLPPTVKIPSAGRLGTVPLQKPGKSLMASFLCEVTTCQVQLLATLTVGKSKLKLHSARRMIKQGQKGKIALALTKKQQALIAAALKKHKKVTASLTATIQSTVGAQVTKPLIVTVKQ